MSDPTTCSHCGESMDIKSEPDEGARFAVISVYTCPNDECPCITSMKVPDF